MIPELVEKAKSKVAGNFFVASYEDIYSGKITFPKLVDAIVNQFCIDW